VQYDTVKDIAQRYDQQLTGSSFASGCLVQVSHSDGSFLLLHNALCVLLTDEGCDWYLVFTEHLGHFCFPDWEADVLSVAGGKIMRVKEVINADGETVTDEDE
jgi:hypothetical protein